ncbi:hypothetical protein EXIGLDRAFT_764234 [Exidia glandulosa HHB12029]|uniref:F-box domain-containing protein n=1 Tax=Exidia glandulosa HHB12029 TaxID=1314781 RepID=A0A165L9W2_EXIGL|nr:hypothetical protein EXIGLDRAFT_764234 [Exidia glandulosa HHB12029]
MDSQDSLDRPELPATFPPELLLAVFDYCARGDLVQAARVSRAWRAAATSHARYYIYVSISQSSLPTTLSIPQAVSRFARQIAAVTAQRVRLAVDVSVYYEWGYDKVDVAALDEIILNAITLSLSLTISLTLAVPRRIYNTLCARLSLRPAHALRRLYISMRGYSHASPLSVALFAGTSPKLWSVVLDGVPLLSGEYPAFRSVTHVVLGRLPVHCMATISNAFPCARSVSMTVTKSYDSDAPAHLDAPAAWASQLARLHILMDRDTLPADIMALLSANPPVSDVELDWWSAILSYRSAPEYIAISDYLQNMSGPLDIDISASDYGGSTTDLVIRDLESGVRRTFREPQFMDSDDESSRRTERGRDIVTYNFTTERFRPGLSKIVALHVEPRFWTEVGHLAERLPSLRFVEFVFPADGYVEKEVVTVGHKYWTPPECAEEAQAESYRVVDLVISAPEHLMLQIQAVTILRMLRQCRFLCPGVHPRITLTNISRIPCEQDGELESVCSET